MHMQKCIKACDSNNTNIWADTMLKLDMHFNSNRAIS